MRKYSDATTGGGKLVKQKLVPRGRAKTTSATVTYHSAFRSRKLLLTSTETIFVVLRRFFPPDQTAAQKTGLHSDVSVATDRPLGGGGLQQGVAAGGGRVTRCHFAANYMKQGLLQEQEIGAIAGTSLTAETRTGQRSGVLARREVHRHDGGRAAVAPFSRPLKHSEAGLACVAPLQR